MWFLVKVIILFWPTQNVALASFCVVITTISHFHFAPTCRYYTVIDSYRYDGNIWIVGPEGEILDWDRRLKATFSPSGPTIHLLPSYQVNNCIVIPFTQYFTLKACDTFFVSYQMILLSALNLAIPVLPSLDENELAVT